MISKGIDTHIPDYEQGCVHVERHFLYEKDQSRAT
jgi:hypothetical protein